MDLEELDRLLERGVRSHHVRHGGEEVGCVYKVFDGPWRASVWGSINDCPLAFPSRAKARQFVIDNAPDWSTL